ncbi:MAG: hypothetical protein KDA92_08990 [Planctomycetales bacterium]|nr:hypothetical protein [Planctomycetales bacterium]MCA9168047.1 hypothetical protein [Planctomycetales bacterium]
MRYRLRNLLLLQAVICFAVWLGHWQTRRTIEFAGNYAITDDELKSLTSLPAYGRLDFENELHPVRKITAAYRALGYLKTRVSTDRQLPHTHVLGGEFIRFEIVEGPWYDDEALLKIGKAFSRKHCPAHGSYLRELSAKCPICGALSK